MTFLPGGIADKLGNRYEHWWTAFRLADVLENQASRIRIEPSGPAGRGVEFEIDEGGLTWGEQVKAASADGNWTLRRLARERVLAAGKGHLEAGRGFRFVATTAAPEFTNLADRSRRSESFEEFTGLLTDDLSSDLQNLAQTWELADVEAWRLLQRVQTEHLPEDALRRLLAARWRRLFSDEPEVVTAELRRYYEDNLAVSLTAPRIWAHLDKQGFRRHLLAGDADLLDQLRKTVRRQQRRVARVEPILGLAGRPDTEALVDRLCSDESRQILILDGRAGFGKSTVGAGVARSLEELGWFVAVARMDSVEATTNSAQKLGQALGLRDSPSVVLAGVADGSQALLVVDQLDAVSSYSGRMSDAFDAVDEVLEQLDRVDNVKVLLVVRTVDLLSDSRLRRLMADSTRVERHTLERLSSETVKAHFTEGGWPLPGAEATVELLRTPLHLAVFSQLSKEAREVPYLTLQNLYEQYTHEVRARLEARLGGLDWFAITRALVVHMDQHETLTAPSTVVDSASRAEVGALESESILVREGSFLAFFHESYFDYLFARDFVGGGGDLYDFLIASSQELFRRAQTRQILEHLAATARDQFRTTVVRLLASPQIRPHLKEVVVGVLSQVDPLPDDWPLLDDLAWADTPLASKIRGLLAERRWFDAVDRLDRWEYWLSDPDRVERAFHALRFIARERGSRVEALVRPFIGVSEDWRLRLRSLIEWSLTPALIELACDLVEQGSLDDARGPIAMNSDFWSIVYGLAEDAPGDAARLIGAHLTRGLTRARLGGSPDPFESGHLSTNSQSDSVISDVAKKAPRAFAEHVLPFVTEVAYANQRVREGHLSTGRWAYRHRSSGYGVDDVVFEAVEDALCHLAEQSPAKCDELLGPLLEAESEELRFLACRALTARAEPDGSVAWLLRDARNLELGWSDSPRWASHLLIEQCSPTCSTSLYGQLERLILEYTNPWEGRHSLGYAQYELLSGMHEPRLSALARRRLGELQRKHPGRLAEPSRDSMAGFVGSPIAEERSKQMSDDNWLKALRKHSTEKTNWHGSRPVGGASQLAQVLGERAKENPERFTQLALRFDDKVPVAAIQAILYNAAAAVSPETATQLCEHAARLHGAAVGRAICFAIQQLKVTNGRLVRLVALYAADTDPDREMARVESQSGYYYGGDLHSAGMNSTRGGAALAAAHILFTSDRYDASVAKTVESLARDPILAVRVCAADGVLAMLNRMPERALSAAEQLFTSDPAVQDAGATERLLVYAVLRSPERFVNTLQGALQGEPTLAKRAGRVWALSMLRDALPPGIPLTVASLTTPARIGAAEVFARNADISNHALRVLFNDQEEEVRKQAAQAMRHLPDVQPGVRDDLMDAFVSGAAFDENFDRLLDALADMDFLPEDSIAVCEKVMAISGDDLGNIVTSRSMSLRNLLAVVLRLYRQGHPGTRARCLDVIDRLTEMNAYGVTDALEAER